MGQEINPTKVVTGKVRFSYLHVFEPAANDDGGEKKYSASLIISKKDKKTLDMMYAAEKAAKELGKTKWGGKIPGNLAPSVIRDGDAEREGDEAYAGAMFVNCSCKTKPGLVDRSLSPIMDQDDLYSGCYGRASINFYAYDAKGKKGVACGLNNLMKMEDGDNLGGRSRAEDDFAGLAEDDDLF
jgi:hypothetical protein